MKIPENVLAVLSRCEVSGNNLILPPGQLDRKLYVATNKVLEELGGIWNRKAKAHVFLVDPVEGLDRAIVTGEITSAADLGWFPTPPDLAAEVINLAEIKPGMHVLEPSAGEGALATAVLQGGGVRWVDLVCFEIDDGRARKLLSEFVVQGSGQVFRQDFLTAAPRAIFDRVVMNPPFARQQDIAHVQHAYKFLKPGGWLVAITSAGAYFREDRRAREFRAFVESCAGYRWIENPDGAFKASGTNVRTYTIVLDKP